MPQFAVPTENWRIEPGRSRFLELMGLSSLLFGQFLVEEFGCDLHLSLLLVELCMPRSFIISVLASLLMTWTRTGEMVLNIKDRASRIHGYYPHDSLSRPHLLSPYPPTSPGLWSSILAGTTQPKTSCMVFSFPFSQGCSFSHFLAIERFSAISPRSGCIPHSISFYPSGRQDLRSGRSIVAKFTLINILLQQILVAATHIRPRGRDARGGSPWLSKCFPMAEGRAWHASEQVNNFNLTCLDL